MSIETIILAILIPVTGAALAILWARLNTLERDVWKSINALRDRLAETEVEALKRFVSTETLRELKADFDVKFQRIEEKLDRALKIAPAE